MPKHTEKRAAHWEWPVPKSWTWAQISEVADVIGGGTPSTTRYEFWEGGEIPWITPADLTGYNEREISRGRRYITQVGLDNSSARLLPARSVLFSSRAPVGYVAIAANPLATNQGFKSFVLNEGILSEYVYFYLRRAKEEITKLASGTTFIEISARACAGIPLPIAPPEEQLRIVAKLDALLSRVAAGEAAARRALDRLQRYRSAVLHAAVTGELTRNWRKTQQPDETGARLLKRLLQERRVRWEEAALKRLHASGKSPKNDQWKNRYSHPIAPDTTDLPLLPKGWTWASVDQMASHEPRSITDGPFGSHLKSSDYTNTGPRVIRLKNIGNGVFIDAMTHISRKHYEFLKNHAVYPGDLVIRALGIPAPRACRIPDIGPAIVKADCIRFKVASDFIDSSFVLYALNSPATQHRTEKKIHGVGRPRLNLGEIKAISLPLPPQTEQKQIARDIERRLDAAERLARAINRQLDRARAMRQSLLREAFIGKLVAQNPKDDPAYVLLQRIRSAREAEAKKPKAKRMPKAKATFTRRQLLDVLREHKKPLTPEQLFREAGFQPKEADLFYRELASLRKILCEKKPSGAEARAWPYRARVLLQLKED